MSLKECKHVFEYKKGEVLADHIIKKNFTIVVANTKIAVSLGQKMEIVSCLLFSHRYYGDLFHDIMPIKAISKISAEDIEKDISWQFRQWIWERDNLTIKNQRIKIETILKTYIGERL